VGLSTRWSGWDFQLGGAGGAISELGCQDIGEVVNWVDCPVIDGVII
jgi:hypothetical protein